MTRNSANASVFRLPEQERHKAAPALIARDEERLAQIRAALQSAKEDADRALTSLLGERAASGQRAFERDQEARRLRARRATLDRYDADVCIGRMVATDGTVSYVGRLGLGNSAHERLLLDWRAPAAEAFFSATPAHPMGLSSRRRYRWRAGHVVGYWDEPLAPGSAQDDIVGDDGSALLASLGAHRSGKMRDVLTTIQADQDAIVRAPADGALVVDGGPGTGKTVVALHRAAYLLYADARLQQREDRLLFVGPHRPYVDYVGDVLPNLGEDGALVCALPDLVPGGGDFPRERDPRRRALLSEGRVVDAVRNAVQLWQRPPRQARTVETGWGPLTISTAEWQDVFTNDDGASHNAMRTLAWQRFGDLLEDRIDTELRGAPRDDDESDGWGDAMPTRDDDFDAYGSGWDEDTSTRETLERDEDLRALFDAVWPLLEPDALLRGVLGCDRIMRQVLPWLAADDRDVLRRAADEPWTDVDVPLIDAVRTVVGDPHREIERRKKRRERAETASIMSDVVSDLIAADDGDLRVMSMLRGQDLRGTLIDDVPDVRDPLAGPFSHIVVDEAQELTDAQWRMILDRVPSGSLTIVGDRAQARDGFSESWLDRLARVGISRATVSSLTVNYRTPSEIMAVAGDEIRRALPDANVPQSIRSTGVPVRYDDRSSLDAIVSTWIAEHDEGTVVVIGDPQFARRERVQSLDPEHVKGLEFDLVVLVDPDSWGDGAPAIVDRYVSMTRATQELVVLR